MKSQRNKNKSKNKDRNKLARQNRAKFNREIEYSKCNKTNNKI